MKIVYTIKMKTAFKDQLKEKYPDVEFIYETDIDEVSLEDVEVIVTDGGDLKAEHVEKASALKWLMGGRGHRGSAGTESRSTSPGSRPHCRC